MSALARTLAVTLTGLQGHLVEVEAHASSGLPGFTLVGLPDAAVRESRERVRSALSTCGVAWGERRVTANLSPADLPKTGTGFDLSLALAVLGARGELSRSATQVIARTVFIGELGLDASVRPVRGVLPAVSCAAQAGVRDVVVPQDCLAEARLVPGVQIHPVAHLAELITHLGGTVSEAVLATARQAQGRSAPPARAVEPSPLPDLTEVVGQHEARHALEVAAAGGHHLLLVGPPGAGKTMMAERLPSILPPLATSDAVTVTSLHSVAGTFDAEAGLIRTPPLRCPHHTATRAAVIGGGSGLPRPGDVSLAHCGVLFLDEAPEFPAGVLDCLRQPLETGHVTIDRSGGRATYPAAFQLVLAANPCPCGRASGRGLDCTCTSLQRRRYFSRLSGPLLDRVDIQVEVAAVSSADLAGAGAGEPSAVVASRVAAARERAARRLEGTPWRLMSQVPGSWLRSPRSGTDRAGVGMLMDALDRGDLTLRGVDRVLRLAWTLADLAGLDGPGSAEMGTALALRTRGGRS
ncbi:YifB family Mg chelatase-like AAA ATPase [Actinomyces faecalis]|uniref:YifB family Mg chelatase-like AAA ATPase n=1 Tax=Actinomyces faecalis TaxID=2722820 RepID=UPI001553CCBC|nr:YifB family Mg chelatase-like AAA ATPase [Actinomyces faecalis]